MGEKQATNYRYLMSQLRNRLLYDQSAHLKNETRFPARYTPCTDRRGDKIYQFLRVSTEPDIYMNDTGPGGTRMYFNGEL